MGRRILGALVVLAAAGSLTFWILGRVPAAESSSVTSRERPADAFAMTVLQVTDGDTIQAVIVSPNDVVPTTDSIPIRLIGIDAPELRPAPECGAAEATAHLERLLPVGATVWVGVDQETTDRYGRRLFNLWTDDGRFVSHELVAAGDAETLVIPPNDTHQPLLRAAEESARTEHLGQWGSC